MILKNSQKRSLRQDFPLLNSSSLVYLDNGATTQRPQVVLDAESKYYQTHNANVHRGVYKLAAQSTQDYEDARHTVAKFLDCKDAEVIFTSGTTHALNLAARILEHTLSVGDEIVTTIAEHHSLFIPFQQLALKKGAKLIAVPLVDGAILESEINKLVTARTKIIALAQTSNVLGYTLDLGKIKKNKAVLVVDAAQSIAHTKVTLGDADMLAFSAHKMYGPMGMGVLAAKKKLLDDGEPLLYGGSMIQSVSVEKSTWAQTPQRYEAGTPNVAGAVALAAAVAYLAPLRDRAAKEELVLAEKAATTIAKYATVLGPKKRTAPLVSFVMKNAHGHDVAQILDSFGVCVRAGHHCCQPLHESLHIDASVRVSFALYNTEEDLVKLEEGLKQVQQVFGK